MPNPRAAQYVRMSTSHQDYSIAYQTRANEAYAAERGYDLVRTFSDPGVSGLTFEKRDGLKALLSSVIARQSDFDVILVYDVSRWGRFQDTDEGAHYEFVCRAAGVAVEYTCEPFANDGSVITSLVKHLKRAMAAEYSRELSEKVSRAKRGLGALGYFQGGHAGYGYRRLSLNRDGTPRQVLQEGERNGVVGGRVTLTPGPPEEREVIRWIFAMRLEGMSMRAIADDLNARGVPGPTRERWEWTTVRGIVRNEKYIGVKVTGRSRRRLSGTTPEPPANWIRTPDAFPPLVSPEVFAEAQPDGAKKHRSVSDDEMIAELAAVLHDHGRLSFNIIRKDPRTAYPSAYVARFGSLTAAYARVGYRPSSYQRLAAERARLHKPHLARTRRRIADD